MRIQLFGRQLDQLIQLLQQYDVTLVEHDPEVIITHGGDGTLLEAERLYPGVPKLPLRHDSICKNCIDHETSHLVKLLVNNKLSQSRLLKIETEVNGHVLVAMNEIALAHQILNQAIRFSVQINNERMINKAIGDGVIIATPFGSHGYYRSITKSTFRSGIGIAYNNTTEPIDHAVIHDTDTVTVTIDRGPAYLLVDNDPHHIELTQGQSFTVRKSSESAILLGLGHIECPDCGEIESTLAQEDI